jgi:hypothetical protein
MKTCRTCKREFPEESFPKANVQFGRQYRKLDCRECFNRMQVERRLRAKYS